MQPLQPLTRGDCSFSLCAVLAEGSDPPAFVVESYTPHHHLDQQLYTSSPTRKPRRVQPSAIHPSAPPPAASTPKPAPRGKPTSGGSTVGIGNSRPRINGRFASSSEHPELAVVTAPGPVDIPLLPTCPPRRPPPSPSSFSSNTGPRTLANTDEYVAWGKKLGISTSEIPQAWNKPAPLGQQCFKEWGWSPPGLDAALQEVSRSDDGWTEDIVVDAAPKQDREDSLDLDGDPERQQRDAPSSDGYDPRPLKRRRTSVSSSPHILSVKPTTRSSLGRARRRSSTVASQSPELRRGFWAREETEDGEATSTPDTPYIALGKSEGEGDREEQDELPDAGRSGNVGLGLDLGEPAGSGEEDEAEAESPVSVGSGRFSRQVTPLPPFPCDCQLGDLGHRPQFCIDTSVAANGLPISPRPTGSSLLPFVNAQQSLDAAIDAFRPSTFTPKPSAAAVDAPIPPSPPVSSSTVMKQDEPPAFEDEESLLAAIEQTLPSPRSPIAAADAPRLPTSTFSPLIPTEKLTPSSPVLQAPEEPSPHEALVTALAPSIGSSSLGTSPASVVAPTPGIQVAVPQQSPDSSAEKPSPRSIPNLISTASALAFKPRRSVSKNHPRPTAAQPTLQVALASAENASINVVPTTKDEVRPTAMLDLLAQREEVKQLKERFFDCSQDGIDP